MRSAFILPVLFTLLLSSCGSKAQKQDEVFPIEKPDSVWQKQLGPMAYRVLRQAATEPPNSSKLNKEYRSGTFHCGGCGAPLFESTAKFESGSGWPSFDRPIQKAVAYSTDYDLGYTRTEEHCANCGGHLGHVFPDGPRETTGMRHCINGVALKFIPSETKN
ncbi:MAG TPA: peptide-methionine (R)-S-oxide reductase [Flavobacteriaceae bacterium]|nr:peptide-methionine (R)-S-oxide reductase [Flavobacteriaceae bacterium]